MNYNKQRFLKYAAERNNEDQAFKKKCFGQNFLRRKSVVQQAVGPVAALCTDRVVLEIGCGDGFLTEYILQSTKCKKLICLEIDPQWAKFVSKKIQDPRLQILNVDALDYDWSSLAVDGPMVLLANLPYNISVRIIKKLRENAHIFLEGVIMLQEEVAQKVVASSGSSRGSISLFLQHAFDFKLLQKIDPTAFTPAPKVYSRLVHFKPKPQRQEIQDEVAFWRFVKACFVSPRRTMRNNLKSYAGAEDVLAVNQTVAELRAQQLEFVQFLHLWQAVKNIPS